MGAVKILLVEDDPRLRRSTCEALRSQGYEVICCGTGSEAALYLAGLNRVDILITDVDLGEKLDGFGLAKLARGSRPSLPILMISAESNGRFEGEKVHGAAFAPKPFSASQLFRQLTLLVQTSAASCSTPPSATRGSPAF
jgi:DNA-binding response OmpR family regulator